MKVLFVQKEAELAFAKLVANAVTRGHQVECRAELVTGELERGSVVLVRGESSVRRKKSGIDVTARFQVLGAAQPRPLEIVLDVEGADDDAPEAYDEQIAWSLARSVMAMFAEQGSTARRDVALYSLWCGEAFSKVLALALEAARFECEIRSENPASYPESSRPWGRIAPGPVVRGEKDVQLRNTTVMLGEHRGSKVPTLKARLSASADEDTAYRFIAAKLVSHVERMVAEIRP